ncbi:hypothetical protein, partial [Nonomuraea sp. SBT364]|uniref:hypothetical protein n=1 Tax=Nonomuraea sp. SBT364 TaxID=1580530 RepID=UPI0012E27ACE
MTADPRWQRLLDLLRPRARTDRPSRRAVVGDALLAAVLTIAALIGAYAGDGETPHPVPGLLYLPMPPALPT